NRLRRLSASTCGIGGKLGTSRTLMASARYRRTRVGTSWVPMIGITINIAAIRNNGSRNWPTQPLICSLLNSSIAPRLSTDEVRNVLDQRLGVLHQLTHQPRAGPDQGEQHHHQAWQKAQRLFVDLCGGLEHGHDKTDQQARYHRQADDQHDQPERFAKQVNRHLGSHREPRYIVPKLAARVPMISAQPSTRTNSMILNGREMIRGESIIMPIAMRILATTMSMIRNGMKIMKPIWNAVFSSEVTNAGTRMVSGTSSTPARSVRLDSRTNSARSLSRVCASIKSRMGSSARLSAS